MIAKTTLLVGLLFLLTSSDPALAEETYLSIPVRSLELSSGPLPQGAAATERPERTHRLYDRNISRFYQPYAVGDRGEEIYISIAWTPNRSFVENLDSCHIVICAEQADSPTTGKIFLPNPDYSGFLGFDFAVPDSPPDQIENADQFLIAKELHYSKLLTWRSPGAAWYRHQLRTAHLARTGDSDEPEPRASRRPTADLENTFSLFTGGRAISENIQLDRQLRVEADSGDLTVPLDSIDGITINEIDWSDLIEGKTPQIDTLAGAIPFDQHALFFPGFGAMAACIDEARSRGTPVLRLLESRSEDALTLERYERQLCLPLDHLARAIGPRLISSVAMTGSDPCLRTGSDVAILFEAVDVTALKVLIAARHAAARSTANNADIVSGQTAHDVKYAGIVSPRREICSYLASVNDVVVVTNSLVQLERIALTIKGDLQSIGALDEYTFFRDRYTKGDQEESAFLIVTDATIRRWCSPRWRIAISRRTRAAAALAELQVEYLEEIQDGVTKARKLDLPHPVPAFGDLFIDEGGVYFTCYGSVGFLTPIVELPIDQVSVEEKDAYKWYRNRYQRNWRQYFDPIAARFTVASDSVGLAPGSVGLDLTVMPLIGSSDYRPFMETIGSTNLAPEAGDRHPGAGVHFITALDSDSAPVKQASGFMSAMVVGIDANPLNWVGEWLSVYAEEDPFWDELAACGKEEGPRGIEDYFEKNFSRLPIVLHLDVASGFKLAAFLTAIHAFVEQSSPGLTLWEPLKHNEEDYVKISPTQKGRRALSSNGDFDDLAVFYAATGDSLIVTLNENALKAALDRQAARLVGGTENVGGTHALSDLQPWLGRSMAIEATESALDSIEAVFDDELRSTMERRSWSNLAILNEWRRLFKESDPVAFHQSLWHTKIVCPGGGTYQWNEEYRTMESTVYGHPGAPRPSAQQPSPLDGIKNVGLGITFERDGLRARAKLDR